MGNSGRDGYGVVNRFGGSPERVEGRDLSHGPCPHNHHVEESPHQSPEAFIKYWSDKGGSERANYQKFINQLCALIGTAEPDASSEQDVLNTTSMRKGFARSTWRATTGGTTISTATSGIASFWRPSSRASASAAGWRGATCSAGCPTVPRRPGHGRHGTG